MPQKNRTVKGVLGGLLGLVGLSAVAGVLVTATVTPALAIAGAAGTQALEVFDKLPSYLQPDAPMEPSTFYGTNDIGEPFAMATFFDQNRTPVTFDQIAPVMYDALLSSEDKSFYEHGGINIAATAQALLENVTNTSSRGASTISQQYVKNVLIQQCEQTVSSTDQDYDSKIADCWWKAANAEGTEGLERKLQEMRYAIQIEKDYSKNEILLGYLNIASFGGTIYGIEAAANRYFSTTAANLTVAQAATLAGMVQNPNSYRIDKVEGSMTNSAGEVVNSEADGYAVAKDRRHYVLGRMLDDGKITQAQYDEADASAVEPVLTEPIQGCQAAGDNAYFCQYAWNEIRTGNLLGGDEAADLEGDELAAAQLQSLQRDGLQIYTTLDMRVQATAIASIHAAVPPNYDDKYLGAAGVTVEPGTGRILAMAQNTTFTQSSSEDQAFTGVNFSANSAHGGGVGFQVGSTYKLFTLVDWLENGKSVNQTINGVNRIYDKMTCGDDAVYNNTKIGNFDKAGGYVGTPMRFTRDSLNSGYLAMAEQLDLCEINAVADRMGVTLGTGGKTTDEVNPYDVLGGKSIAPLQMATAYATIANGGISCTPRVIDRIVDQSGAELTIPGPSCTQVITPEVAATAAYALAGVMNGGTGSRARTYDGVPLIGKTGTHETWSTMMIESSTRATTAVWVGRWNKRADSTEENPASIYNQYFNGQVLQNVRYGIARDMQTAANTLMGGGDAFPQPDSNLTRQVYSDLPSVVGMSVDQATSTLDSAGFSVVVGDAVDSDVATGLIAEQSPGAGRVAGGSTITISPSNGQGATVPDVTGDSIQEALTKLRSAGLTNIDQAGSCRGNDDDLEVSGTNPAAGSAVNRAATVTVTCK